MHTAVADAATFAASVATDSTNSGYGTLDWNFSLADHFADFLAAGETLTLTYNVGITDDSGVAANDASTTKTVVITITGTNDQPVITQATSSSLAEQPGTNNPGNDTAGGTVSFTDVDLTDRPTVTAPCSTTATSPPTT